MLRFANTCMASQHGMFFFTNTSSRLTGAVRTIIADRLRKLDFQTLRLPIGAAASEPHIPVFASKSLASASRIIILFYEADTDPGILSEYIIRHRGGIAAGSVLNFVSYIATLSANHADSNPPAVILANIGQSRWWRNGQRALTQTSWINLTAESAVEGDLWHDALANTVPRNRTAVEHIHCVFEDMVDGICKPDAQVQIIGVQEGAMAVSKFLDNEEVLETWGNRIRAFASLGSWYDAADVKTQGYKDFMLKVGLVRHVNSVNTYSETAW